MAGTNRPYTQRERPYMEAYLKQFYPHAEVELNRKVGPITIAKEVQLPPGVSPFIFSVFNRRVDAMVFLPDHILFIEFKRPPAPGVIGQMSLYLRLGPMTYWDPRFQTLPIRGRIVWPVEDTAMVAIAREAGIEAVIWPPPANIADLVLLRADGAHLGRFTGRTPTSVVK